MKQRNKIGLYGPKTRSFQRKVTKEMFGLSFKTANVYAYLGDRSNENPDIDDIGSTVFYEVPDRAYADSPVNINIGMDSLPESALDFSRFGLINPMQGEQTFRVHVDDFKCLGRDMVVGDVFEIPFFERDCKKSFWEVTDVDDKPSYEKFYFVIHAVPLGDARTTREIPINRSNSDTLSDIMVMADEDQEAAVPFAGLDESIIDDEFVPPEEPVDSRNEWQSSFLDNPDMPFTFDKED